MNSHTIARCLTQDRFTNNAFRGVFPCDLLFKFAKILENTDNSYVCNTADSFSSGDHWIAIHINREGIGEYFDSYGLHPTDIFTQFLNFHSVKWTFNTTQLQSPFTTVCGQYCIYWLHEKGMGHASDIVMDNLKLLNGDKHVLDFVNKHYIGVAKKQLLDRVFLKEQISRVLVDLKM